MLWPITAVRDPQGELTIGGVRVSELAAEFGTPLYLYDAATIRARCRAYRDAFAAAYPRSRVVYAGKAYLGAAILEIIAEEGLWLDVVSGGELVFAVRAGFPPERIVLHGNNKSAEELALARRLGIGEIVVDNHHEIDLLETLARELPGAVDVLLRVNPGIDAHTHEYRKTGIVDSKFGLLLAPGDAARAVERLLAIPGVRLRGYHAHVGSQINELEPFVAAVDVLFGFAAEMRARFGVVPEQISPGGGLGIQYLAGESEPDIPGYAEQVAGAVARAAERTGFPAPLLAVEPGRSIIGPAGVATYRVGAIKEIPGIRRYVCVDGGMGDNIRPALYGAEYTAELADRAGGAGARVTIAGKYCESGDVLIGEVILPEPRPGDLVVIPAAGAYCLAMASNYNLALRPAVVLVGDEAGAARLIQRRETYDDLLTREVGLVGARGGS
ncbi:MAG TPA: diaminopimelate decarboxylase [Nitrolancea sp.]|nr:diaminopimelate decarboxylase [Nitrolancea sp.]